MIYKHKLLNIQEIWFDENQKIEKVDKVIFNQVKNKVSENSVDFHTLVIDLNEPEEEIFKKIKKNNKYEINRANNKDNLNTKIYVGNIEDKIIEKFVTSYNKFAIKRKLGCISYDIYKSYSKEQSLIISNISNEEGDVLSWHTYIHNNCKLRLILFNHKHN